MLLTMVLAFCFLPFSAYAASGECGVNLSWTLDDSGTLTISGSGDMYNFAWHDFPWISQKNKVKKVVVAQGVTSIGDNAFYGCGSISQIIVPNSVSYIGEYAFYKCTKLSSITLPAGITEIGANTFYGCANLASMNIPEGVKQIYEYAFSDCTALRSVALPSTLRTIAKSAFRNCDSLTGISIPDNVSTIGTGVFSGCVSLETAKLPRGLRVLPESLFSGCEGLTAVEMSVEAQEIGKSAFYKCKSLESIRIPASLTKLGNYVVDSCESLTDIYYEGSQTQWESISGVNSSYNKKLKEVTIHYNSANPVDSVTPDPQSSVVGPGSIINQVLHTDIRAYIDGHPIRSFNIEGNTAIVAEDLSLYGFKVVYKNDVRSLYIDEGDKVIHSVYRHTGAGGIVGTKAMDVYYTDIKTYSYGYPISGYNVNGYTVIFIDDLAAFGTCYWDGTNRTISFYRY